MNYDEDLITPAQHTNCRDTVGVNHAPSRTRTVLPENVNADDSEHEEPDIDQDNLKQLPSVIMVGANLGLTVPPTARVVPRTLTIPRTSRILTKYGKRTTMSCSYLESWRPLVSDLYLCLSTQPSQLSSSVGQVRPHGTVDYSQLSSSVGQVRG